MHFIVKLFPEIIVKSPPVRRRQTALLRDNLVRQLQRLPLRFSVHKDWEKIEVKIDTEDTLIGADYVRVLSQTPGIAKFSRVSVATFSSLDEIPDKLSPELCAQLNGKSFAVRVKRSGQHTFSSVDVERLVGAWVLRQQPGARVSLRQPDHRIELEVRGQRVFSLQQTWPGLGGYPLGSQGAVLSLLSGGYDSSVASFQMIRRGLLPHFVFFNLGGAAHELAVREVAYHLWSQYASSHSLEFVSVDFAEVVESIRQTVPGSYANIILKRMMLRVASQIGKRMKLPALVTGDAVAQVSSQTLTNLSVTEAAAELPVLRPLVTRDKGDIIDEARRIGTADLAASIPEYCGIMADRPTTEAKLDRVLDIEAQLPPGLLDQVLAGARTTTVSDLLDEQALPAVRCFAEIPAQACVIDIRHPEESERSPLHLGCEVKTIPFYAIQKAFDKDQDSRLSLLYCDRGLLSRLHAELLMESGATNVGIYRPSR